MKYYPFLLATSKPEPGADLNSFKENIDDVERATLSLPWQEHPRLMFFLWGIALCISLPACALAVYMALSVATDVVAPAEFVALLPLLIPVIPYIKARGEAQHLFFRQMAEGLGLTYANSSPFSTTSGKLFAVGRYRQISDVLFGKYRGLPMRLFEYQYTTGSGKSATTHTLRVCELTFPRPFTDLMIVGHDATYSGDWGNWKPEGTTAVKLEGDFNYAFSVYAKIGEEAAALRVLEPNIMAKLMDNYREYGVECYGTKLYLFTYEFPLNKQAFAEHLSKLDDLLDLLIPELEGLERD